MIELYMRIGSRYRRATPGEVVAAAQDTLSSIGRSDVAQAITMHLLDTVGYQLPTQVEELPDHLPPSASTGQVTGDKP